MLHGFGHLVSTPAAHVGIILPVQKHQDLPQLTRARGFIACCIGQRGDCGLRQPVAVQRSSLRTSQTMLKRRRAQRQGITASTVGRAVSTVGCAASTVGRVVQLEIVSASDTLISVRRANTIRTSQGMLAYGHPSLTRMTPRSR